MRKYEQIWNTLKRHGKCTIAARREYHHTIIKAVIKEKYNDDVFKLDNSENSKRARLYIEREHGTITFVLKTTIGIDDL